MNPEYVHLAQRQERAQKRAYEVQRIQPRDDAHAVRLTVRFEKYVKRYTDARDDIGLYLRCR